jgi:hypothetical protein
MNADPSAPAPAPELDVPSWVPEPVAHYARTEYAAEVSEALRELGGVRAYAEKLREWGAVEDKARCDAEIVREDLAEIVEHYRALVSDPQMRGVWRELSRPRNGAFLHPARAPSAADAKERQAAAMVEVFKTAFACQVETAFACQEERAAITTRGKAEQQRRRYLARAEELGRDAFTMLTQPLLFCGKNILHDNRRMELGRKLNAAADAYKEYARGITSAQPSMPERGHDGRAHWVALTIGSKFRDLFGKPMYGLTATIASVVLGREIDRRTVRQWCAHPAVKPQKIVL